MDESQINRIRSLLAPDVELGEMIGQGGMAQVYRAYDRRHQRSVAIKVLMPELAKSVGAKRFLREIEVEAGLQHPNILTIHDSGEVDGLPYYVMPFIDGETLRDRIERERQLSLPDALEIARAVASALDYAHENGILHRDIKPANILLSDDSVHVADFGVAAALGSAGGERLTESGVIVGTPAYMSPEQAGAEKGIDARSDVYSLGCVVYEMLSGQPPFTGLTSHAVLARHLQEAPPSIEIVRPNVPSGLDAVLKRALAKVPADRFSDAGSLIDALENPSKYAPTPPSRVRSKSAIAALGAVAAAIVLVWQTMRPTNEPPIALDMNKVVGFPFVERGERDAATGEGEAVALLLGAALQYSEPLRWIDGWSELNAEQRADVRLLERRTAAEIARRVGA